MNRRTEIVLLCLVLLLAAGLRMARPGVVEFKRDEALLSHMALEMARGRHVPLHGITSSVGVPNPPVSVYLFAIPYFFSSHPLVATLFVALLNVVAVALAWWLARRCWGAGPALWAALLYAASPWGAIFSRKIWAQNLLPPFVLLAVIAGLRGFIDRAEDVPHRWRWQAAHLVLMALVVQIHMAAVSLLPLTLALIYVGRRRLDRRLWWGAALAALTTIPFMITVLNGLGGMPKYSAPDLSLDALRYAHMLASGTEIHSLAGPEAFRAYLASVPNLWPLLALEGAAALLAAAWLLVRGQGGARLVGLWVLLPVLAFSVPWTPVFPHYLIAMLPGAYVALGAVFAGANTRRWVSRAAVVAAVAIAVSQAYLALALFGFLGTHNVSRGFGAPLRDLLDVREAAFELAWGREVVVLSSGVNPEMDQTPAVWRTLLYDHAPGLRYANAEHTLVYPGAPALWLIVSDSMVLPSTKSFNYFHGWYTLTQIDERPPRLGEAPPVHDRLANGVTFRLYRYALSDPGAFWLWWEPAGPVAQTYSLFIHVLDAGGARIAQTDVPAWPGPWRADDLILTRFALEEGVEVPLEGTWRVGMYYFREDGSIEGVDVLDAAGNPVGKWVDVPVEASLD